MKKIKISASIILALAMIMSCFAALPAMQMTAFATTQNVSFQKGVDGYNGSQTVTTIQ